MRELRVTATRQAKVRATAFGGGPDAPLQFGFDASWSREAAILTLSVWIADVAAFTGEDLEKRTVVECHCRPPYRPRRCPGRYVQVVYKPGRTIAHWAEWLDDRMPRIRSHPDVAQLFDELTDNARMVRKAIDRPADQVYVCACAVCGAPVFADEGADEVGCRRCRRVALVDEDPESETYCQVIGEVPTYSVLDEHHRRLDALRTSLLPANDVRAAVTALHRAPVNVKTFRSWLGRGTLPALACSITDRAPLYLVDDALSLARRIPQSKVSA